jgi:CHAT domain
LDYPAFLDFEIEIGRQRGRVYPVSVLHSPAGETRSEMRLPFTGEGLRIRLSLLESAVPLSGVTRVRKAAAPQEAPVQTFGDMLFSALFSGEVLGCYDASQRSAREQHSGLRIKLRVQAPELAVLPWEFLYDARHDEYVCLSRRTPLVRHVSTTRPSIPLAVTPPLRILAMVASPAGLPALDTLTERSRLERALGDMTGAGRVELEWLSGQTWEALRDALWHDRWHVLHFVGHGSYDSEADEGLLALADDSGNKHLLTATQIGHLLADNDNLRLVVLNACEGARGSERDLFSSTAGRLVASGGVAAVVAMQYEISDQAAIQFAKEFYTQIARGAPVDAAVTEVRLGMSVETRGSAEWGTPVLYMQSADGRIFDIAAAELPPIPRRSIPAEPQAEETPALQTEAVTEPPHPRFARPLPEAEVEAPAAWRDGALRWLASTAVVFVVMLIALTLTAPRLRPTAAPPPRSAAAQPTPSAAEIQTPTVPATKPAVKSSVVPPVAVPSAPVR